MPSFVVVTQTVDIVCINDFTDEVVMKDLPHLIRALNKALDALNDSLPSGYEVKGWSVKKAGV